MNDQAPAHSPSLLAADRLVLHTSGSTGVPKQIEVTRAQLVASARATGEALGLQAGMRALVCLNTAYVAGLMMLVRCEVLGMEAVVIEPTHRPMLPFVGTHPHFDFTALVPMQLQATLESEAETAILDEMHAVLVGGASVSAELIDAVQRLHVPIYHTFGMTETVSHIALRRLNGSEASEWFVPLPSVQLSQDDRECLVICAPMTNDQPIVTNDRVELAQDGRFRWLGRIDHVINSGGVKVQAEKVERVLQQLWPNRAVLVTGSADATLGETITAIVEGAEMPPPLPAQLLALGLHKYELPRRWLFVPKMLLTATGKIDRPKIIAQLMLKDR